MGLGGIQTGESRVVFPIIEGPNQNRRNQSSIKHRVCEIEF